MADHSGTVGCLAGLAVVITIGSYVGYTFWYAPGHHIDSPADVTAPTADGKSSKPALPDAEAAVRLAMAGSVPNALPRLEFMKGNNLDIYIMRSDFEVIPFPDREEAVRTVGKAWCGGVEKFFLPSVRLRDIENGKVLGSYGCVVGNLTVAQK